MNEFKCDKDLSNIDLQRIEMLDDKGHSYVFKNYIGLKVFKSYREAWSISFTYEDIFEFYDEFSEFLYKIFKIPNQSYDCFETSQKCNLRCPYCFQGDKRNTFKNRHKYEISNYFIEKIMKINFKHMKNSAATMRLMGGEPLLDLEVFKYTFEQQVKIMKKLNKPIDDLWIYTNYTTNKIHNFLDYVDSCILKHIKHLTIVATSDSLDINKSLRIKNQKIMDRYKYNIKETSKRFKDDDRVTLATNLMFSNYEESKKTALDLVDLGVEYIQIAYDEFTSVENGEIIKPQLTKIFEELEKRKIPRLKPNLGNNVWLHFSIMLENENEVYRSKLGLKADYNVSTMNDY